MFSTPIISLILAAHASVQAPITLRYKFRVGQTHSYTMNMQMDMKTESSGRSMPMNMNMTMLLKQTVKSVASDGSATISSSVTKQSATMNGKASAPPTGSKDMSFTMTMSPTGSVSGISGAGSNPAGMAGFDPNTMQVGGALPTGPVHVGSQWTSSVTIPSFGKVNLNCSLTRLSKNGVSTIAVIHSTGVLDLSKLGGAMAQRAPGMSMSGTAKIDADTTFDVDGGYLSGAQSSTLMNMAMQMNNPQTKAPMNFSMTGNQKMSMKIAG